jgi:DNA-directed RNA polymerase specialized sigma24 family protein
MLRPLRSPSDSHEDVFVHRYARLLAWAGRLTGGDRLAAEDLVHDAFVNFILSRPNLDTIQNLDGYLFTSLRHLHLANVRRGRRRANAHLPLVEYDSALDALRTVSAGRAHEELTTICHYACVRRRSSKAASALIFRFFHGYALAEIAIVLRLPPRAVDTLLSVARREVRAWMDNPRPLDALGRPDASVPRILAFAQPDAFVGEVQCAIFESVHGACHSSSEIEQLYEPSAPSLDADTLAHIVSCRTCLDRLPGIGLLSAAERSMPDGVRGKARSPEHRRFSHRLLHVSRRFLGYNSFLAKLNATGTALIFSSYLGGGTHDDRTTGVAINAAGYAYLAGHSMALDFPVIHPALQPSRRSNQWDAVVVRVALGNPPGFSIEGLTPRRGGNAGSVTLRIIGTGFQAETTARLACGDQPLLESSQPFVEEGGRALEAWFDLRRTAPSTCDVTVRNLGGTESTQRGAFVVEEGGGARLSLNVLGPSAVRPSCPRPLPSFSRTTARAIRVSFRFRLGFQHRVPPFDRSPLLQQRHYQAASCKNSIDRTRRSECHLDTQL